MTRHHWTRTPTGHQLAAGGVWIDVERFPGDEWTWRVTCAGVVIGRSRSPSTDAVAASRRALAWVRQTLGPIVDAVNDSSTEMR